MRYLKIEKAKEFEECLGVFSNPNKDIISFELQNEDGSKHEKSDELKEHLKRLLEAKEFISKLLG